MYIKTNKGKSQENNKIIKTYIYIYIHMYIHTCVCSKPPPADGRQVQKTVRTFVE